MIYKPNRPSVSGYVTCISTFDTALYGLIAKVSVRTTEDVDITVHPTVDNYPEYSEDWSAEAGTWWNDVTSIDYDEGYRQGYAAAKRLFYDPK